MMPLPALSNLSLNVWRMRVNKQLCATTLMIILTLSAKMWADDAAPMAASKLKVEAGVAFTEGPVWHPTGNVYFSDIANNRIMRRDRKGELHVFRTPSGRTNGMVFDQEGRLLCCEGGGLGSNRRVTRTELDGTITVLADNYRGKKFNSPNDLTIDAKGRLYFSDPRYGDRSGIEQFDGKGIEIEGVYRIDDVGKVERVIAHEVDRPNGLAISPDGLHLYVADNVNDGPRGKGGNRKLWRFNLNEDGSVQGDSRKLVFDWGTDRGPDGMAIDLDGRLYVAAGFNFPKPPVETAFKYKAGVYVLSDDGKLQQFIPVPADMITNCAFGDDDLRTLYITAGHKLWSIRTRATGHVIWPKPKAKP
jgi:gluconolactonase